MMYARSNLPTNNQIFIFIRLTMFVLGFLPGCGVAADIKPITPEKSEKLKPGLMAHKFDIPASDDKPNGLQIIFIESGKTKYAPRLIGGTGRIGTVPYNFPATLQEFISYDAPVVISGAYSQRIGGELLPLGYLKSSGNEISARFHHSWLVDTFFCTDPVKSTSGIFWANDRGLDEFSDCVETGPRLLQSGRKWIEAQQHGIRKKANESRQNYIDTSRIQLFVCKADSDPASPLGIGITTDEMDLPELNNILLALTINNKKVCRDAVALSGSISAGMLINGRLVAGNGSFLLTSAVAFARDVENLSRGGSQRKGRAHALR
jgi:hypothetical protein